MKTEFKFKNEIKEIRSLNDLFRNSIVRNGHYTQQCACAILLVQCSIVVLVS